MGDVFARTGANGSYTLEGLDVGLSYTVSFVPACASYDTPYQEQYYASAGNTDDSSDATAITATPTSITGINGNLDTGASITGTVDDASGNAITSQDICVTATPDYNDGTGGSQQSATTNASGNYTITGLTEGTYYIQFADCSGSSRNDVSVYYARRQRRP